MNPEAYAIWLVEIDFGGLIVRLASEDVVVDSDGGPLDFHGVLGELEVVAAIAEASDTAEAPEASIVAVWPVDVAARIAAGHGLSWSPATVSRWVVGSAYEDRQVMIRGRVNNPTYGATGEPVGVHISGAPWQDTRLIPPSDHIVTGANYISSITSLDADQLGKVIPRVYGCPGRVDPIVSDTGRVSGARGRRVDARSVADGLSGYQEVRVVVAEHHVSAQRVYALTEDDSTAVRVFVRNGFDDEGHPIAFLPWFQSSAPAGAPEDDADNGTYSYAYGITDFDGDYTSTMGTAALTQFSQSQSQVYVVWTDDEDSARGGLVKDGVTIRSAGDVIEDLLEQSTMKVDRTRMGLAKRLLQPYLLDFAIDARVTPWEFIVGQLLPLLPVSVITGPDGVYLAVWRYDATAADAVAVLDTATNPTLSRVGLIEEDSDQIVNDVTVKYARSVRTGVFNGTARVCAEPFNAASPDVVPDRFCQLSQQRYRTSTGGPYISERVVEAAVVYDRATAFLMASTMARGKALARRFVEYDASELEVWTLMPGAVVLLSDADVSLSGQVALLREKKVGGEPGTVRLRLQLLPGGNP